MANKRARGTRSTPPRKTTPRQSGTTSAMPITDGDVKWAVVQVDEAAERLKAAEHAMLGAQRELADRSRLAAKMSEANALSLSALQMTTLAAQRSEEAERRQREARLAKEQAEEALERKRSANTGLAEARAKERDAVAAVAELQRALSSAEPSEASSEA